MTTLMTDDWKKQAAQMSAASNADIEKSFFDLAYTAISNRVTPMMRPEFRVGFEIVHKNEENTRMVGIFIFRVAKELFYIPTFFINGDIKGQDLLYRHSTKTFVPATNDWAEYLVGLSHTGDGHGIPITERRFIRNQMNLQDVIEPPISRASQLRKFASAKGFTAHDLSTHYPEVKTGLDKMASEFLAHIQTPPPESLLRKFIEEDGSFNAIRKIANTAQRDRRFATAMMTCTDVESSIPALAPAKAAGAKDKPVLSVYFNLLDNPGIKSASAADLARGYQIADLRKDAEVNDVLFRAMSTTLSTVTDPAIYDVLVADGSTKEMLVAWPHDWCPTSSNPWSDHNELHNTHSYPGSHRLYRDLILVEKESKKSKRQMCSNHPVYGKYDRDIEPENDGVVTPESGKAYRIYDPHARALTDPFYVTAVDTNSAGLKEATVVRYYIPEAGINEGTLSREPSRIVINPDYDNIDYHANIVGKGCAFVEVAFEKSKHGGLDYLSDVKTGTDNALNNLIFDEGYKMASVTALPDGKFAFHTSEEEAFSAPMNKLAAKFSIMVKCATREATAEDALKEALESPNRKFEFFFKSPAKLATNIRFNHWPDFFEDINNQFNVPEAPQNDYALLTDRDEQYVEPNRVGDRYSAETQDTIDSATPDQLAEISQQRGNSNLFESGVIGSLIQTYDSIAMVEKWIPDMETALDRIGRTLTLLYWKPEDFAQAYGTDDQSQLENKLLSNFKSFGALVIELVQKAKKDQEGTVPMT